MYRFNIFCLYVPLYFCLAQVKLKQISLPGQGPVFGVEVSKQRTQKIMAYYGIPYAKPPVGSLRFAPPVIDPLPEIKVNYTDYPPSCLQAKDDFKDSDKIFYQLLNNLTLTNISEDCLYLNIFVPQESKPKQGFATIVWLHPGNFVIGSPAVWNPHTLVYRQRVIVVTIAYRLNIMGFFTTLDGEATGNYGLMDQQAAMYWIKNNIKYFGGNPNNICVMGYGAGATSIGLHMVNPQSRGLFDKAITMSGNYLSPSAVKRPEDIKKIIRNIAQTAGCDTEQTSKTVECLRKSEADLLVQHTSNIDWRPLLDYGLNNNSRLPLLAELPVKYFERGEFYSVPLLTGYTHMEQVLEIMELRNVSTVSLESLQEVLTTLLLKNGELPQHDNDTESSCVYNYDHIIDAVMFFYGPTNQIKDPNVFKKIITDFDTEKNMAAATFLQAAFMSRKKPTYVYRFDMKPSTPTVISQIPDWASVPHLFDLIYVWGVPYWEMDQVWDSRDKRVSDTIMSVWTNFAKSSDPTATTIYPIKWDRFSEDNPGLLLIDLTFNMSNTKNLNYKAFEFWNEYYPKVKEMATRCCEVADHGTTVNKTFWLPLLMLTLIVCNF